MNIDALSKEKFQLQCHDIIEIFPPEEPETANQKSHLLLQVKALPQDVQSKGEYEPHPSLYTCSSRIHVSISSCLSPSLHHLL